MASYNPYKKIAPNGVYAGSGVNPGGNVSRPANLHMGGSGVLKGGASGFGTLAKPKAAKPIAPLKPITAPKLMTTRSMKPVGSGGTHTQPVQHPGGPSRPTTVEVKPVAVAPKSQTGGAMTKYVPPRPVVSKFPKNSSTAALQEWQNAKLKQKQWDLKYGKDAGNKMHAGPVTKNPTTTPVAAPALPKLGDLSTHDTGYAQAMLDAGYEYDLAGNPINQLTLQRDSVNPLAWIAGRENLLRTNNQNTYEQNAALAARGIFNSGERINQEDNRNINMMSSLVGLNNQVGSGYDSGLAEKYKLALGAAGVGGAAGQISSQITQINADRNNALTLAKQKAELDAYQRAVDAMNANPPSTPATPEMAQAADKQKAADARKNTGWYTTGGKTYFRNEAGKIAVVDPKIATAAWKAKTKRSGT